MKLSKGQGISFFASIVLFTIFSIVFFLMPLNHTIEFWLGYFFAVYATGAMFVSLFTFFNKDTKEGKALSLPTVVSTWIYFILQMSISAWEMTTFNKGYLVAIVINLILGLVFLIIMLSTSAAAKKIDINEQHVKEKILFNKQLMNQLAGIVSSNEELMAKINTLVEDLKYSDPMSHSQLKMLENEIADKVDKLEEIINDSEKANELCDEIKKLIKNRNRQCITLKGVKDTEADKKISGGNTTAVAGTLIALAIVLVTLTVSFYIIPEKQYKIAKSLIEENKYDEAIAAFTVLEDYKDSKDKIDEVEHLKLEEERQNAVALKDEKYNDAIELMKFEKYDEALTSFGELDGYKDSDKKIDEITEILNEQKYNQAENYFKEGDYESALTLYTELGDYKQSKDRIIEINNRQSSGTIIYLGMYDNEPIAWRIVKTEQNKMLLLADKPLRELPITDDVGDVDFEDSYLAEWLNNDFISEFTENDLNKIIETDGLTVFLLNKTEVDDLLNKGVDIATDSDWWICSESKKGFKYVTANGQIKNRGDLSFRDKGVRPAIWIDLK